MLAYSKNNDFRYLLHVVDSFVKKNNLHKSNVDGQLPDQLTVKKRFEELGLKGVLNEIDSQVLTDFQDNVIKNGRWHFAIETKSTKAIKSEVDADQQFRSGTFGQNVKRHFVNVYRDYRAMGYRGKMVDLLDIAFKLVINNFKRSWLRTMFKL